MKTIFELSVYKINLGPISKETFKLEKQNLIFLPDNASLVIGGVFIDEEKWFYRYFPDNDLVEYIVSVDIIDEIYQQFILKLQVLGWVKQNE